MKLGDNLIMMGCPGPKYKNPRRLGQATQSLYVNVSHVNAHFQRARKAGATVIAAVPKIQKDISGISRRRSLNVRNRKRCEKPLRRPSFYAMKYRQAEIKRGVISRFAGK
jgi:hypothetical protein